MFFEARCFCLAHGIMEWWNNGMLILKESSHFLTYSLPCKMNFSNKPKSQFPKTQYSIFPVFSPRRRLYPPACRPYGLEAEPEAGFRTWSVCTCSRSLTPGSWTGTRTIAPAHVACPPSRAQASFRFSGIPVSAFRTSEIGNRNSEAGGPSPPLDVVGTPKR